MIKGVPGRKQDLPGTTIRKNMKKIEEKVQKIKENKENLRKCSYLAHPGVRQATDSETSLMPVSSVSHVSDRMELHNNSNWASNDLLHTARLSMRLDTPLHGNNARGTKYAVYYASVVTHTVFENIKWLCSALCRNRNVAVPSLDCLFPG